MLFTPLHLGSFRKLLIIQNPTHCKKYFLKFVNTSFSVISGWKGGTIGNILIKAAVSNKIRTDT